MEWISNTFIEKQIHFLELISALELAFKESTIECPPKLVYDYKSKESNELNTALLMPAWDNKEVFGVKLITATPHNSTQNIPYLNGMYVLFNAANGFPIASMDAKLMTNIRTAATSVLAARFLAKKEASSVLILGNGSLSPYYISAYAALPHIKQIYLWGLDLERSKEVVAQLQLKKEVTVTAISDYKQYTKQVDIISCITSAHNPLIEIDDIAQGQHFDLVGSYKEDMQEVSTAIVAAATLYTDNLDVTPHHAGEIVNAVKEGKMQFSDIKGDLKALCATPVSKRTSENQNTVFKCTGMALEDLVFAQLAYNKYKNTDN